MSKMKLNRIKSALAEKGKTGRDLAKRLDKTESTVSRWCTNEVQPSLETLFQISKFLEVEMKELLTTLAEV